MSKQEGQSNCGSSHGYAVVLEVCVAESEEFLKYRVFRRAVSWPVFRPMVGDEVLISDRDRTVRRIVFDLDASQIVVELDGWVTRDNYADLCKSLRSDGWSEHLVDE